MYSIALLIVELQTAKRKLLKVLEVPNGKSTGGPPAGEACRRVGVLAYRRLPDSARMDPDMGALPPVRLGPP